SDGWRPAWVKQWDLSTGREVLGGDIKPVERPDLPPIPQSGRVVKRLAFSREGDLLAWIDEADLGLKLQNLSQKQQMLCLKGFPNYWNDSERDIWGRLIEKGWDCSADGRILVGFRKRQVRLKETEWAEWVAPRGEDVVEVWDLSTLRISSVQQVEALP